MIRWLHISDLHIRRQADWNLYKKQLFTKCEEIGKIDFVIVTGDFHDFNDKEDFSHSIIFLKELVGKLELDISRDLFLIPGNHDGASEIDDKDERELLLIAAKAKPLDGKWIGKLLGMFKGYETFVKELIPDYPDEHPASVHIRDWNNQISFIHCNTAIGADGETNKDQVLDINRLSELNVSEECPAVILAHNSFFDLHKEQQSRVKDFINNNKIRAYFCGDRHKQEVRQITYRDNQNKQIPCVVSYKSAPDSKDRYSAFGIIVGTWENEKAVLKGWIWNSGTGFKEDKEICGQEIDMGCSVTEKKSYVRELQAYHHSGKYSGWVQIKNNNSPIDIEWNMRRFLQGYPCTWALAFSDVLVKRQQLSDIVQSVKSGGIYALLGAGAEGKSTLLKQACVQLYYEGYTVLFHNMEEGYKLPEDLPENTVLVIDEPDDTGFRQLIDHAYNSGISLIFASRQNEWNMFCKRNRISSDTKRAVTEIQMQNITDEKEAAAFADCVIKYYRSTADRNKLINNFLRNVKDYGYLYAAMLLSINDKEKLEEIAEDIVDKIRTENEKAMELLAYAVLYEHIGVTFGEREYTYFVGKLELKPREVKEALELELRHSGSRWETRHPQISGLFYNLFFEEGGEYDVEKADGMRWKVLSFLLQKYSSNREKKSAFEDIFCAIQLINEANDTKDMIKRVMDEFRSDMDKLMKIFYKLKGAKNYEIIGRMCYEYEVNSVRIVLKWAKAAKELNGVGGYEIEDSALWIYRTACIERKMKSHNIWLDWARLENETNGAGTYEKENSALWIYREACIERQPIGHNIWLSWAELENETNGAGTYKKENSALWIYKKACIERQVAGSDMWLGWAKLEKETNGTGTYKKENSALWIYREACIERQPISHNIWLSWAELENEINGAGTYEKENSALWIYKKACIERQVAGSDMWMNWAKLERETNGAGGYEEENSALWIYKEACIGRHVTGANIWLDWARCVENSRLCDQEWTVEKIYQQALTITKEDNGVLFWYGKFLMNEGRFEESRSIYRKLFSKEIRNYLSTLLFIEAVAGNYDSHSKFCVDKLVCILEENVEHSYSTQYALHVYYRLQKNEELANKYYAMLDLTDNVIVEHVRQTEQFLEACQKAYNLSVEN